MGRTSNKRTTLLQTAATIVKRDGYSALTLEAVAAEAGVSKGGLLYHFSTKEALVAGLIEALITGFEAGMVEEQATDSRSPGTWTRAYLRASVTLDGPSEVDGVTAGLIAAVALDPNLLEPLRERYAHWEEALDGDGLPGVNSHIVRLAADGIWLADLLGLAPPTGERRRKVIECLLQLGRADENGK